MNLKPSLFAVLILFNFSKIQAQLKFPVTNNELRNNLQKIIADFPRQLTDIRGEILTQNPQSTEFASLLKMEGTQSNTITQYNSTKPIYSWQAIVLTTESFDEAVKKYKWLFGQLKAMTVNLDNGHTFTLHGNYDAPEETKLFSSSIFKLIPSAIGLPKLKIEVSLQYYFPEWKVNLLVYEKEREDYEKGPTKE